MKEMYTRMAEKQVVAQSMCYWILKKVHAGTRAHTHTQIGRRKRSSLTQICRKLCRCSWTNEKRGSS